MTTEARFERQLPAILEDLYLGPSPDYRDEVLATAVRTRQRPAWTFPGRWLPVSDIAGRSAIVPRLPWRSMGLALVILALLVVAALVYVGSRTRVPPPFGVARNGQVAFSVDGDIYAGDPLTGATTSIALGAEVDRNPIFSRDGTRIAFLRQAGDIASGPFHVAVVGRDGGAATILTTTPVELPDAMEWSPDGTSIIVNTKDARLTRYDVSGKAAPVLIAEGVHVQAGAFRPPNGAQIVYQPDGISGTAIWVMNADGASKHALLERGPESKGGAIVGNVRWSPDGRLVAFGVNTVGGPNQSRITVMKADGTSVRQVANEPGVWVENDLVWSPDSARIAFNRWQYTPSADTWSIKSIGVVSIDGGPVGSLGPAPISDGALFDWSPDGSSILSLPATVVGAPHMGTKVRPVEIDATLGTSRELAWDVNSAASWQRLAP